MADPWDQLESEPDEAYARFLLYRNLGPGRSLEAAYNHFARTFRNAAREAEPRKKTLPIPGHWCNDSSAHRWVDRAHAWDVYILRTYAERMVVRFIGALDKVAEKVAVAVANDACRPRKWQEVLSALDVLARYVTPDAVKSVQPAPDDPQPGKPAPAREAVR